MTPLESRGMVMPRNDSGLSVVLVQEGLTDASVWTLVAIQLPTEGVAVDTATKQLRDRRATSARSAWPAGLGATRRWRLVRVTYPCPN